MQAQRTKQGKHERHERPHKTTQNDMKDAEDDRIEVSDMDLYHDVTQVATSSSPSSSASSSFSSFSSVPISSSSSPSFPASSPSTLSSSFPSSFLSSSSSSSSSSSFLSSSSSKSEITRTRKRKERAVRTANDVGHDLDTLESDPKHKSSSVDLAPNEIDSKVVDQDELKVVDQGELKVVDQGELKGPPLRADTIAYFSEIQRLLSLNQFESSEDLSILLQNVHKELIGKEYRLAVHKRFSQTLELIIQHSSPLQLRSLLMHLKGRLVLLFMDRNSSHVLEALIRKIPGILAQECMEEPEVGDDSLVQENGQADHIPTMRELFKSACKELKSSWLSIATDPYGSHLLRSIVSLCCGEMDLTHSTLGKQNKNADSSETSIRTLDHLQGLGHVLPSIVRSFIAAEDSTLEQLEYDVHAGPVIQLLLDALHSLGPSESASLTAFISRLLLWTPATSRRGQKDNSLKQQDVQTAELVRDVQEETTLDILEEQKESPSARTEEHGSVSIDHTWNLLTHRVGSHLIEKIILVAPDAILSRLQQFVFNGHLVELSGDSFANFCVQRLLERLTDDALVAVCFDELKDNISQLFEANRAGVVVRLLQACIRVGSKQKELAVCVARGVGINNPSENPKMVERLLQFNPSLQAPKKSKFSLNGSLIVQTLLQLPAASSRVVHESLAALPVDVLIQLATDPCGSRVIDSFLTCDAHSKIKAKILDRFNGKFATLGSTVYGSFIVEKIYQLGDETKKASIAKELLKAEQRLAACQSGKVLLRKCRIEQFKRSQQEWSRQTHNHNRTLKLFSDIIGEDALGSQHSSSAPSPSPLNTSMLPDTNTHDSVVIASTHSEEKQVNASAAPFASPARKRRRKE